ncbi:MAG TPA: class I SAM-dependent methyltransferase [Patescibacteria group bacterium]|nr:class I SAM-dependent methyltransferase [Patescibacteria group bacterium]
MPVERLDLERAESSDILVNEHWLRYKYIREHLRTEKVLDIACGSGYGSYYLSLNNNLEVIGADVNSDSITKAQKSYQKDNLKFQVANALSLPFKDKSFDSVVSLETIEHFNVSDQKLYLAELKRVLKPKGKLWLSTPNAEASKHKNPWHLKELSFSELQKLLANNFKNYKILKQGTALATVISSDDVNNNESAKDSSSTTYIGSDVYPKYYLAIASDESIEDSDLSKLAVSLNFKAFARLDNHPLKKISDSVYHPVSKVLKKFKRKK